MDYIPVVCNLWIKDLLLTILERILACEYLLMPCYACMICTTLIDECIDGAYWGGFRLYGWVWHGLGCTTMDAPVSDSGCKRMVSYSRVDAMIVFKTFQKAQIKLFAAVYNTVVFFFFFCSFWWLSLLLTLAFASFIFWAWPEGIAISTFEIVLRLEWCIISYKFVFENAVALTLLLVNIACMCVFFFFLDVGLE